MTELSLFTPREATEGDPTASSGLGVGFVLLLRIVAVLWLGYLLTLAGLDRFFIAIQPPAMFGKPSPTVVPLPTLYYVLHGLAALSVLGLAMWQGAQVRLGRAFLPLIIVCMSALPTLITILLAPELTPGPLTSAEGMSLRLLPVLFMALVLVAWQYRWRHVVLFSLGMGALGLMPFSGHIPAFRLPFDPGTLVALIQTISFLTVGYCISALMNRLHTQHVALAQAHAQLRHYASTLEQLTISRERNRLARELHDTLAHTLSGLTVQLETVKAYWDVDPSVAKTTQAAALEAARAGLQETRRALKALRASPLDDLGLSLGLRELAATAAAAANLQLTFAASPELPLLAPDIEQCIYRIAQEALANVIRHANARHLIVQLTHEEDKLSLVVQDDGCGFDVQQGVQAGHFGLAGMRERAQLAGGQLLMSSQPGAGTLVRLLI